MRIITRATYQMLPDGRLKLLSEEGFDYDGPIALCDRGQTKAATNQASQYASADQAVAGEAFKSGSDAISGLNKEGYNKWLRDSQTFAPGGTFAQTMQGNETAATQGGKNSTDAYLADVLRRTGGTPGTQSQVVASSEEAGRQNQRDEAAMARQDEIARLAGLDAANKDYTGTLQEVAGDYGSYYGPSLGGASNQMSTMMSGAKQPGFWDQFLNNAVQAGGEVAAGYAGKGCWIAAELFDGWSDPRTILVRDWLNGEFREWLIGRIVMAVYLRVGKRVAGLIRRFPFLRRIFTPLFNRALHKARASKAGQ